jgi:pimeloyl-ACP methyl ester carboxylesterase
MKAVSPAVRLAIVPATGHLVNLEEPDVMHRLTEDLFALVDTGKWRPRGR